MSRESFRMYGWIVARRCRRLGAGRPPPATQIAGAVLAAPDDRRAGAKVLGWDAGGKIVTLREGTNDQVCVADNPKVEGFNVACYHKDLDPSWRAAAS